MRANGPILRSVVAILTAAAGASVAPGERILLDPPPRPSGGSGVDVDVAGVGEARWVELDDPVGGYPQPLLRSDATSPADPAPSPMTPSPTICFDGVVNSPVTVTPPDTHIAVGPNAGAAGRVVMVTNGHLQIWDKTGTVVAGPTYLDTVFGSNCFDPKVLYDQHAGRFFIVCLEGTTPNPGGLSNVHIAVSSDATPSNLTTDWTFLVGSGLTNVGGYDTWCDYPGIGADSDSLFTTFNLFDSAGSFRGMKIRIFDKAQLIAGSYWYVDIDYDAAVTSVATTQPAHVYGTTDNGGFYLVSRLNSSIYRIYKITGDPGTPAATTSMHLWSAGAFPSDRGADQCTVASPDLDTLASRVMNAVYRDGQIWLCLTANPDGDGQTEVVWQVINTNNYPTNTPSIAQSGYIDGTGTSPWTYMPSINVNSAGDAAICFTQSSSTECPGVWYAMRESTDPAGTFQTPVEAKPGPGYYDSFWGGNPDRWGDYSATVVDPTNDSFWIANEFAWSSAPGASEWATHICNFAIPCCPTTVTSYPYIQGFNGGYGDWVNAIGPDDTDWKVGMGSTPTPNTGPTSAHSMWYYLYIEATGHLDETAILEGPCLDLSPLDHPCLMFWYHMYGSAMGTLSVEVSDDDCDSWAAVWTLSGDQGDAWHPAVVDLSAYSGTIRVRFKGVTGSSDTSDMAIDDVSVGESHRLELTERNPSWGDVQIDPEPDDANDVWFQEGTPVTLTALPIEDKELRHWEIFDPNFPSDANHATIDANISTTIVMDSDMHVNAVWKCGSGVEQALPVLAIVVAVLGFASRGMRRRGLRRTATPRSRS